MASGHTSESGELLSSGTAPALLEVRQISRRFGPVLANDDLSIVFHPGEIHALLGENGAGKSTLLNLLSGMLQPDSGQIVINGQPVTISTPATALELGIGTVFQHFTLVSDLTVWENLQLGRTGWFLQGDTFDDAMQDRLELLQLTELRHTEIQYLSLAERQRVEIAKALSRGARVLLLDEPTAVLSATETAQFFGMLTSLRLDGVAVVLITHKLEEALNLSDRVTVLRQGRVSGELSPALIASEPRDAVRTQLLAMMFTQLPTRQEEYLSTASAEKGEVVISVRDLDVRDDRDDLVLRHINLELRRGEIFGVAGVDSNGQKELAEALAGQRRVESGEILLGGRHLENRGVRQALAAGIGYLTDDRIGEGIATSASVAENLVLKAMAQRSLLHRSGFWVRRDEMSANAARLVEQFRINTASIEARAGTLSGGNMQRLMLARELALNPQVLICNKPSAGLDLRTTEMIFRLLRQAADDGMAILLISPELEELLAISDRIGVMYRGEMVTIQDRASFDTACLNRLMVGIGVNSVAMS